MKSSFSLTYVECQTSTSNILESIVGPALFETYESAIDSLFIYVRERLSDGLEDVFEGYIANSDTLCNFDKDEAMGYVLNDYDEKTNLIDYYFDFMKDDKTHSSYSIVELPTSSLLDQIIAADAIEIDDNFIRHFNIPSPEEYSESLLANDLSIFLEASMVNEDMDLFNYSFSVEEIINADYNTETKSWNIGEFKVVPIKFA